MPGPRMIRMRMGDHGTIDRLHRVEEGAERASAELLMLFCNELGIGPADIYRDLPIPHP